MKAPVGHAKVKDSPVLVSPNTVLRDSAKGRQQQQVTNQKTLEKDVGMIHLVNYTASQ